MGKSNEDFTIPFYIVEEIISYIEETIQGRCKCMRWENIKSLLRLAQVNGKLSDAQVKYIMDTYCRE